MRVEDLLAYLTHYMSQEVVRIANIKDPTSYLKASSKLYVFSYFAARMGEAVLVTAGEKSNLDPETFVELKRQLEEVSADHWDIWVKQAKECPLVYEKEAPDRTSN